MLTIDQTKVPIFPAADLDRLETFDALIARAVTPAAADGIYHHAAEVMLQMGDQDMVRGLNLFGPGAPQAVLTGQFGKMRSVSTAALHQVIYSGQASTIQSLQRGFYEPTTRLLTDAGDLQRISELEPFYQMNGAGRITMVNPGSVPYQDTVAVPLCGPGLYNYGHFLYDGLPVVLMLRSAMPDGQFRLVSNRLEPWQRSLLQGLGLLHLHLEVRTPVRFPQAVVTDLLALHVSYPTRFVRPVFDALRFRYGGAAPRSKTVLLSRANDNARRPLVNRQEMEDELFKMGVEIVRPETLSIPEQIAIAASAALVIGESGAAMANVGFCDPGASVLEIQNEAVTDGWTRAACRVLGLRWHLYSARSVPGSPGTPFRVDVKELASAVAEIRRGA